MKLNVPNVEILNKQTKEVEIIPLNEFINHKSSTYASEVIKPKTLNQSFNMLRDMVAGQVWQSAKHSVRLQGLDCYAWEWNTDK
jgi:hypothetical protein